MENLMFKIGLDVGSTTIKCIVLKDEEIVFKSYERHKSLVVEKTIELLLKINNTIIKNFPFSIAITGSAGMGIAQKANLEFVQEVYATKIAASKYFKDVDVIIELGGEDAKILFLSGNPEVRMNGSCAGGTGAFIDQMAVLLKLDLKEFDNCALKHKKIYSIASRCGVFAKSDIQPLINQGAQKNDLAASIFQAVVNQTIAGLSQGREIKGKVMFLGGPLTFFQELKNIFKQTLNLNDENAIFPENSEFFVAIGASIFSNKPSNLTLDEITTKLKKQNKIKKQSSLNPLFENEIEYLKFKQRHKKSDVKYKKIEEYSGNSYLGIDAGSTTTKIVLMSEDYEILFYKYLNNNGEVVSMILNCLKEILEKIEKNNNKIKIKAATVTGYGEELIKNAFLVDFGLVETLAHLTAAQYFSPNVDFVIDIGGQDIKCFKLKNKLIDSITLNEACSSGCGSFLETFATSLGFSIVDFAKKGLFAKSPVDLGSRCTVFMNSSVKQAQKDGALLEDISAGLSISVVKNAIYKVIRAKDVKELGENIVVQGGTFLNDAVLRAFEQELGFNVTRPSIAGLMGAFGCAIYSKKNAKENSTILNLENLNNFKYEVKTSTCSGCQNRCMLTINIFSKNKNFVSGNKCDSYFNKSENKQTYNMAEFKYKYILNTPKNDEKTKKIGIPLVLNMYENLPFWSAFFESLNFKVVLSDKSNRKLYELGQYSIPSDTVCYPAKIVHGHIESLLKKDVDLIFYPSMTYNFNENISDNYYNCPIVAYYPEVVKANIKTYKKIIIDHIGLDNKKYFEKFAFKIFNKYFKVTKKEIKNAADSAYLQYFKYKQNVINYTKNAIEFANKNGKQIIVVADKPYHIDPEINHGIYKLIANYGYVVLNADAISFISNEKIKTDVLNQWSYHARLYTAAKFISDFNTINILHIISFGCGTDAIVSDELKRILELKNKLYTCIKIDEINNLGAIKIRIRSMFAAIDEINKNSKQNKEHILCVK